jgi:hypothetical protein
MDTESTIQARPAFMGPGFRRDDSCRFNVFTSRSAVIALQLTGHQAPGGLGGLFISASGELQIQGDAL